MYIAVEGIDCAGKSTQINLLKQNLPDAVFTFEPGASALGKQIREIVLNSHNISERARFLMFLADRAEHIDKVVAPALLNKKTVISDRSFISGMAYYLCNADSCINTVFSLNNFAIDYLRPDKVIFLSISEQTLTSRLAIKAPDAIEAKGIDYLLGVQNSIKASLEYSKIEYLELDGALEPKEINLKIMDFIC